MEKVEKEKVTFNFRKTTADNLKEFCNASGTWNSSVFADVAVQEKLDRDKEE